MGTTETSRQVGEIAARGEDFHVRAGYRRSRIARHLWKTTALTTLALALSGMAAHGDPNGLWQPQIRAIIGADNNGGNAALEGFIPLKQTAESVLFLDVRAKHDFKDGSGQDVGLGIRRIVNPDLMIGGYAYLNLENYNSTQFTAVTLGAEAITPHFDAHVNVYLPIKGDSTDHSTSSTLSMVSNQLIEQISVLDHRDYAAWGIEGEIGAQVPVNLPDKHSLRLDIGGYHFEDPHGDDGSVTGAKAGFEYTIGDVFGSNTELVFAGEVRNDNRDDTQFAGSVRLNIPFNPGSGSDNGADSGPEPVYPVSEGLRKRVNERVRGDIGVRVQSQTLTGGTTTRVAINAATNAAFGKFYFADGGLAGAGTLADPTTLDDAVTKSGANGFVVALGGNGNLTTGGVTLANGQTVIGGGESVTARLFGGGTSTFNLGGSDGTIQGTNVANPVITLGNGNTLNGITITGGADGIFGNNITGATLTNVTVTGAGGNGANFTGSSTGITGSNFTATGNGLDGLHIDGDGTYNFTGTTLLQGNLDDGLDITGKGTYTFAIVNAQDNTDRGITVQGTSTGGTFTTTGGTVSGNGGTAVFIDPITAHVVLDSISQSGGTSGVVLENVAGSFTVNGATTISDTTGPAIAISDSPAAIRFGDINITNPGADGISFAGVNAAVVAGNIVISGLGVGTGLDFSGSKTNFTAQSLNITGTGAAGSIGIDLTSPSVGGAVITITAGGVIAGVDTGVRFGLAGSPANSANAEFIFGGGSIAGITASLDARGLNQTLGHYAFGSTAFSGPQLFDQQNVIFVGSSATGSGDGSSLANLAAVGTADGNTDSDAIFVLVNDGTAIDASGGFSLSAGQTLASFGNGRTFSLGGVPVNVTGENVEHDAVISDPSGAATLTNSGAGDVVTLANNSSLLDFNISGGSANGVHGSGVSAVTISGLSVSGAGLNGVLFDGTNSVTATNLTSVVNAGAGLSIQGDGTYTFNGTTTLSGNTDGLLINGNGTYAFETLDAKDNGGSGVDATSTGSGSLSTTGGIISGNGGNGFSASQIGLDVTLTSLSHTGIGTGVSLSNVTGSFDIAGTTTISNASNGIFIQNSSATVGFGGKVTVTAPTGSGIILAANSGAITFGDVAIDQPGQNAIDIFGTNGAIGFGNIDITGLPTAKTGLDLSGSNSTFTATSLDIAGAGTSTGIDLSGTAGGSVTIGAGVISAGTGVQMGTHGASGTTANTTFVFGASGVGSITGTSASLDMRGLSPGSGSYAFNTTVLNGPQLFDIANVVFVGSANTGLGDGSSVNDLINATAADALAAPANTIFVLVNNGAGNIDTDADGFTLADGQQIVSFANGASVDLGSPPANVTGTNVISGTQVQDDPFGNGGATLNNAVGSTIDVANGNVIENLTVSNAGSGAAIDGSGVNGLTINGVTISSAVSGVNLMGASGAIGVTNLNIQAAQNGILVANSSSSASFTDTTIGGVSGIALSLSNYSGTGTFTNFDITGAGAGVGIVGGSTGTMTFDAASSIAGTTGIAFNIDTATPNVTYHGTINQTAAASAVKINAMTGGTATFGGLITANTGFANAIDLTGNTGGTINFNGGLNLTTDGGFAFSAIDGGTLSVTGTNTVATGAGVLERGIQIGGTGMTIGTAGVNFASVTVDGSGGIVSSGIVIQNTAGGDVTFGAVDMNRVNGDAIRLTNVSNAVTFNGTTKIDTVVANGPGFAVQDSSANVTVNNLVTTLVSGADVSLANNTGTIGIGGTITNSGIGDGVVVFGGSAAITVSANIASSAGTPGTAVKVDGTTGGSATFDGSITSTGTGNLFAIGSSLPPVGGAIGFIGSTLSAVGGGGAVVTGLAGTATLNVTVPLSITNAAATGLSVANVASTASATFGTVTVSGATGNGIDITNNAGAVTFGTTSVTMGSTVGPAGINFAGTNADVTFGTTNVTLGAGANQTGIDFSGSSTAADFGLTTITGTGDLTSRGIDLSSTTGNKVISFLQGSKIDNVGIGVDLSSGLTTATTADAIFTFGDGDSTDGLESFITAASGGYTVNTVGLDPTKGSYDFDDVFFTGSANLATAPGSVILVSQSGGFVAAGTTGNLSVGVNTISLAAADALTGAQNFAFVGTISLGATTFTLDSGQTIAGFGNGGVVSTGTIQPANVQGNLGATGGNVTGDEAVVNGTANLMQLLGDNAVRNTAFDFSGATGSAFLIDQGAVGFSNAAGITIEGVTISNVAAGQTAVQVTGLNGNLSVINNNISVAGALLNVNGGTGTISVSRGFLPNGGPAGTLTGGGISIANRTGGAVTFTDQVTIAGGNGVSISGGSAAGAVNFNGGLDITTSAATGLDFSGLNVLTIADAGSTTINATGQTAASLQGTLGAGGVNFDSVTASGGASGIIFDGVAGTFTVTGATTITGTTGAGISAGPGNTGTFNFGALTVNNVATAGNGINWASGTLNVSGLANIDTAAGVGIIQIDGTTSFTGGMTIDTTTGNGIMVGNGAINISATSGAETLNSTLGVAMTLQGTAANIALDSTSSGGANINVLLNGVTGTVSLGTGALTGAANGSFVVAGGTVAVSYAGTVTNSTGTGTALIVQDRLAGAGLVSLSGNLTSSADGILLQNNAGGIVTVTGTSNSFIGTGTGIAIVNNTGGTYNISGASYTVNSTALAGVFMAGNSSPVVANFDGGGLKITNGSTQGFFASGAGTISVTGAGNTITATGTGTALNLDGVTVGAGGVNFSSISTSNATIGIALNNVASSGGGAIALGTVDLQGIISRGVDVSGTLGAALSFSDLDIGLNSPGAVAFDLNGATINAAVTANDFDVTNASAAGASIGVDLRGAIGGQVVRLGDAAAGGASSSIAGVNTGVFLNSATNLNFTFGDGESTTDQTSTINANVGIDASSAPVAGTYNFQDVKFQSSPGLGFGIGKIYFVGAASTGDGSGRDQSNLATLADAEFNAAASDIIVLVNDGGVITAASTNGDDTLLLLANEQVRGFDNGNINLALTVPLPIQLASNTISIADQTPGGTTTLTSADGASVLTLGASGNVIDGFTINGNDGTGANAAIGISASGTANATIRNMTISSVTATDIDFGTGATGTTTLTNLSLFSTGAAGTGIKFGAASGTVTGTNVDFSSGGGLSVVGGDAVFNFDSTSSIANFGGTAVRIQNRTGGSFGFAGTVGTSIGSSGIAISGATGANTVSFSGAVNLTSNGGTPVSIDNGGQASTVSFANLTITTGGATTAFTATNGGTVNVATGSISTTANRAVNLNGIAAGINFTSTTSGGGANNVALTNVTGTVNLGGGALSGATGTAFLVSGGSANIDYNGTIAHTANATAIDVQNHTGTAGGASTISFDGTVSSTVSSDGINLIGNGGTNGTNINFTNTLTINTSSSGATGFNATGGGTVTVQATGNTITSGTGTALNVANTNIGASGLTFQSISASGAVNGIVLNNTGSGGLTVTGVGTTAGSGGTIQNTTGRGASFISASNITLKNMNFTNAGTDDLDADNSGLSTGDNLTTNAAIHLQNVSTATLDRIAISGGAEQGINGNTVSNFTLSNSSISNAGNGADEDGIHFYNMSGTSAVTNTTITGSGDDNFQLQTQSGTLALTISGGSSTGAVLGSGYLFGIRGTSNATINFSGANSSNNFSGGIVADAFDNSTMNLNVINSTSSSNNDQLSVSAGDNSDVSLVATGNTLSSTAAGDFVVVSLLGSAFDNGFTFDARIESNTITVANGLIADGISVFNAGGGAMRVGIKNNSIDYAGTQRAILVQTGQDGAGSILAQITGNAIDMKLDGAGNAVAGILVQSGITSPTGDGSSIDLNIGGAGALANTFTHSLGGTMAAGDIRVRQRNNGTINLSGYAGAPTDLAAAIAYLNGRNTVVSASTATADSTGFTGLATAPFP
ncbi:MAG: S-layer family protein [Mesorhizobium sp.]|nr:MAG: S-layer family protein [Mesorhizobium sp.]